MRVDFDSKEIIFNNVEVGFIDRVNSNDRTSNLVSLSTYWDETFFSIFLARYLKFGYKGCMMDTECYVVPENLDGIHLDKLTFNEVVATCGFTESVDDFADQHEGYNYNYKITG